MPLDLTAVRSQFPALARDAIFLDNPAGTQVARTVLDRMSNYLVEHNANHEGAFATSRESDALVENLHHFFCGSDVNLLVDQGKRHRIQVIVTRDVIIDLDCSRFSFGILVGSFW